MQGFFLFFLLTSESWQMSLGILVDVAEKPDVTLLAHHNKVSLFGGGGAAKLVLGLPGVLLAVSGVFVVAVS